MIKETVNRLKKYLAKEPYPNTLIIHVGACDLFSFPVHILRAEIKELLWDIRRLLPKTRIIWSDILLRYAYDDEREEGGGKSSTINLNKSALRVCRAIGNAHVIRNYNVICPSRHRLRKVFRPDHLHLNDHGNAVFRDTLSKALVFFNSCPESVSYTAFP